jgi:thiol-disulfide isomerase/thioredoxin
MAKIKIRKSRTRWLTRIFGPFSGSYCVFGWVGTPARNVPVFSPFPQELLMPYLIAKDVETFTQALKAGRAKGPTLVEFFAPWCHYCKDMERHFKKLGARPNVTVLTIDYETHEPALKKTFKHKVDGFPFMLAWKSGARAPEAIEGAVEMDELVEKLGVG